jgi:putative endonuclease
VAGRGRLDLGASGEEAVADWYRAAGYEILARNWRCREGELDIVAAFGKTLVFCEVKTRRTTTFGTPAEAITMTKQRRLRTLAARWLAGRDGSNRPFYDEMRFDVAAVMPAAGAWSVEVIEAAF